MFKNHKRGALNALSIVNNSWSMFLISCLVLCNFVVALAGHTRNTVNIEVHVEMIGVLSLWTIIYGIARLFSVNNNVAYNDDDASPPHQIQADIVQIVADAIVHSLTYYLQFAVLLLLCKNSLGQDDISSVWRWATVFAAFVASGIIIIMSVNPGQRVTYWPYRNVAKFLTAINFIAVAVCGYALFHIKFSQKKEERPGGMLFAKYMLALNSGEGVSRIMTLSFDFVAVNLGICGLELSEWIMFAVTVPLVYFVLKRDCQYWSLDVDEEDEITIMAATSDMAWKEGVDYDKVVIPKTAVYFKKKLHETMDTSVELHLWQRRMVVVKRFKFDLLTRESIKSFKKEASILLSLRHPNVVDFYGVVVDPPSLCIVIQYAVNGDLFEYINSLRKGTARNASTFAENQRCVLIPYACALQVARGMQYLHDEGIVHRDLKSLNVMLDDRLNARIADFGESALDASTDVESVRPRKGRSKRMRMTMSTEATGATGQDDGPVGTPGWAAPEALLGGEAGKPADVFSFAIVVWELLTWFPPAVLVDLSSESARSDAYLYRLVSPAAAASAPSSSSATADIATASSTLSPLVATKSVSFFFIVHEQVVAHVI